MTRPVAVTGFGLLSPLGRGPEEHARALRAGRSGIVSMRPAWRERGLKSQVAGLVDPAPLRPLFDRKQARFLSDSTLLSAVAFQDAVAHAGLTPAELTDPLTGVIMGTGGGASMPDAIALGEKLEERGGAKVGPFHVPRVMGSAITANLSVLHGLRGHSYSVTSACATSAHAILLGLDLIRSGRQVRVFAGGAEDVNVYSAAGFDGMNALSSAWNEEPARASRPLDRGRDGFVFAGGAGVVVLEDPGAARARGARILALLRGASATCDGEDMVLPNGRGAQEAMRAALRDAGAGPEQVDYINLHGTSTPAGDLVELEAIRSVFGRRVPPFSSTKSMTGHTLGAAGVHEAIFCLLMLQEGFLAPSINLDDPEPAVADLPVVKESRDAKPGWVLSNSFGFGGTNASLVFSRPEA